MNKHLAKARKRAAPRLLPVEQVEALRLAGRQHSSESNWIEASDSWQRVLELLPDDYEARYRNAQSLFHLGSIEAATVEAGKAWQLSPQDPRPGVILARGQHRLKQWEAAALSWQRVATLDPRSFEAMFRLAQAQANLAHYAAAHDAAQRALVLKPNDGETLLLLQRVAGGYVAQDDTGATTELTTLLAQARELTHDKQWSEAEAAWLNYSKRAPREFEGFYRLAQACQAQNKIDQALAAAKHAASLNAKDPRIQLLLARLLTGAADFVSAEDYWWQILATQPNDFEANYRLGQCMLEQYKLADAKKWLSKALVLMPDHEGVALLLSRTRARGNVAGKGRSKKQNAAQIPTFTIDDQVKSGRRLIQEKDWQNAESCWWYVLSHRPDDFEACYRLGQCLLEQGNPNDAKKWLTLAQATRPDHEGVVLLLARVRARDNMSRRVQSARSAPTAISADKLLDQVLAGRKLIQDKNWEAAEACWWQVLALKPEDFEANYRLGQCLLELGDAVEARKWLDKARQLRPEHENVALLLSRLLSRERMAARKPQKARKPTAAQAQQAQTTIERGRALIRSKDWEAAEACWWQVLALKPEDFEANYRLGQCLLEMNNAVEAKKWLDAARKLRPDHEGVSLLLGRLRARSKVSRQLLPVTGSQPVSANNLLTQVMTARKLVQDKNWQAAEEGWWQVLAQKPDDFEANYRLGQCLLETGNIVDARKWLDAARKLRPDHEDVALLLSRLRSREKLAKSNSQKAPAPVAPKELSAAELGRQLIRSKDWETAEACWWQVLSQTPEDFEANYRLGQCLLEMDNIVEARKWLETARQLRPDHEEVALLLSRLRSRARVAKGKQQTPAITPAPVAPKEFSAVDLGRQLIRSKDWQAAETCWWQVLAQTPEDFEANYRLGQCLLETGNIVEARKWLEAALRLSPDHEEVALLLSRLRSRARVAKGKQDKQSVTTSRADAPEFSAVELGRQLIRSKDWQAAETCWWQVLAQTPDDFEANYRLGQCLLEMDNAVEAKKWLEQARTLRPDHEDVLLLLSRLRARKAVSGRNKQQQEKIKAATPSARRANALALMEQGALVAAKAEVDAILTQLPDDEEAQVLLKRLERRLAMQAQFTASHTTDAANNLDAPLTALDEAREASAMKDWGNAVKFWTQVIAQQPDDFEAFYRLAQAHYEAGDMAQTLAHSARAQELRPAHTSNLTFLGRALQRTNAFNHSIAVWEDILDKSPGHFESHFRMGQCLASLGLHDKAEQQFTLAQQLRPDSLNCHMYRTAQMVKLGRLEEAIADWRDFLQNQSQDSRNKRRFVAFLKENKRSDLAEPVLHEMLAEKPDDLDGLFQLSSYLLDEKRWTEALELLGPFIVALNDDSDLLKAAILRNYAVACDALGNLTEAEKYFRASLALDGDSAAAITRLARVTRQLGKPDEALALRRRACELASTDISNWHELIFLLASLERETEAREALAKAEAILPPTAATFARFGRICESALFLDDATRYFAKAMAMDPSTVLLAGQYYARNGIVDKALEYLTTARESNATSVETAKALIAQLRICELFGMTPEQFTTQATQLELLAPELLFEHLVASSLAQPIYQAVPGRVVLITGSLGAGGAERQLVTTIRGLVKRPDLVESVTLLAVSLNKRFKRDFYLGDIEHLPVAIRCVEDELPKQPSNQATMLFADFIDAFPEDMRDAIRIWYRDFIEHKPEIVHAWQDSTCLTAVVAAALAGVPRIMLSTRSTRPDNPRRRLKRYMQRAFKAVMKLPNVVMLNNSKAGASDYEDWLGLSPGTVKVIYNGIDFDRLLHAASDKETAAHRKLLNIPKKSQVLGGVFRMSEEKRPLLWLDTAAEVLQQVPDAHFVIAGDGPMRDDMVERAQQLGISHRLHLPGHVQVASWFKLMDVVLLTSRMEGLPNVLLEAQSFGIPVVAPAVGGVPETILQNKTGWAVPAATAKKLAEKITHALLKQDWYQKAQTRATSFAKDNFSVEAMVAKTLDAYGLVTKLSRENAASTLHETDDLQLAQQAFRRKELDVAATHLALVTQNEASNIEAWRWLGRTQQGMGAVPQAIASWRRVLALQSDDFEALFRLAEQLSRSGDDAPAILLLKKALLQKSEHDAAVRLLARLLQRTGQQQEALMFWGLVHTRHPDDFEAAYRGGQLALAVGDDEHARELLTLAIALEHTHFKPVELLARHLIWRAELRAARKLLTTYLHHSADSIDAMTLLGTVLTLQGRQRLMQRWLAILQQQSSHTVAASLRYARWLLAFGEYDKCAVLLQALTPRTDSESKQHQLLQITVAIRKADFEQAANLCTNNPPAEFHTLQHDYTNTLALLGNTSKRGSVQDALLAWCERQCKLVRKPVYEPIARSVLHVVNSLAMGGTEKQSAITAAMQTARPDEFGPVTLLRVDPAHSGRAVFFLPYVKGHNVKTGTLDELAGPDKLTTPLDGLINNNHFRNAMGIAEIERLYRAFLHTRPAVVHAWTPQTAVQCAIAGLLAGVPRIVLRMGSVAPDQRPLVTPDESIRYEWFQRVLQQVIKDKRIRLVANCERNLQGWLAWIGANPQKTGTTPLVTYNIIDVDQLGVADSKQVTALRTALKIRPTHRVIGSVTRFEPEKGLDLWLECVERVTSTMPNALFVLIGNGRLRDEVLRQIDKKNLGKHVRIVTDAGAMLAPYYSMMDVFLQTSLIEGLPNTVLEAQVFNVPIVATDVGGTLEAVADYKQALLAKPEAAALVSALTTTLTKNAGKSKEIAVKTGKRFSATAVLSQIRNTYRVDD